MPPKLKLTIFDENYAVLYNTSNRIRWILSMLIIAGIFILAISIWIACTFWYGDLNAWYVIGLGTIVLVIAFLYIFAFEETVIIDKIKGQVKYVKDIGTLFRLTLRKWDISRVREFTTQRTEESGRLESLGTIYVKLVTGRIIATISHGFNDPPNKCTKYANLFLKGEYVTPGTIIEEISEV